MIEWANKKTLKLRLLGLIITMTFEIKVKHH